MAEHYDVLIVGAGLSGICAAYYLGERCPEKTWAIVEQRDRLGGTWELFRYPGIRSDSDMYTLGFSFFPWKNPQAIADGPSILAYLQETAQTFGIDRRILFGRKVVHASWSSERALWTVRTLDSQTGEAVEATCHFLWWCSGYYRYDAGHTPDFEGIEDFAGAVVHPQQWTDDIDWAGKRVVVIGSGATAVTLVPELAKDAKHVTMLQRSPTYIISRPQKDGVAERATKFFGPRAGFRLARWKNVFLGTAFFELARARPALARKWLVGQVRRALGPQTTDPHFTPTYDVWDQRLCLIPDGDLFAAIRSGRASVVTDHIDRFVAEGILLRSGEVLEADLVVTATGLVLQMAGGCEVEVDGERVQPSAEIMYKGAMLSGVPNAAMTLGYTNASWTLKCELVAGYVCRLLRYMDANGYREARPRRPDDLDVIPLIDFSAGYVTRALPDLPSQGSRLPWRLYQNYLLDQYLFGRTAIEDGSLELR